MNEIDDIYSDIAKAMRRNNQGTDDKAEALKDAAFAECLQQAAKDMRYSGRPNFHNKAWARFQFIDFLYYGNNYPKENALIFHRNMCETNTNGGASLLGFMEVPPTNIRSVRMTLNDDPTLLYRSGHHVGSYRFPVDFPAAKARRLYDEFAADGCVLDPCAGWGGRLVGFLASKATEYNGYDASPAQIAGDNDIFDCFKPVLNKHKTVSLNAIPFEDTVEKPNYYDFILTSPPYYDTELYIDGPQSWRRYNTYEFWRYGFLRALIEKCYRQLKQGHCMILALSEHRYPLVADAHKIAKATGFTNIEVTTNDDRAENGGKLLTAWKI